MSRGARRERPRGARVIAVGAPALAALTLSMLVLSSQRELDAELQLEADERVAAGTRLPLRARLYAGLSRVEGPQLVAAPCRVELRAPDGAVLARTFLRPGLGPSLEGSIAVPSELRGAAWLHAVAAYGEPRVTVELPLQIMAEPPRPVAPSPRRLPSLKRFALAPVRPADDSPPDPLQLRVRGGACVPEQTCELLVHVGEPAASVQLRATPSVSPDATSLEPSRVTAGVVALQLTAHGPEAVTELIATRAGEVVASRALRLPIALGSARVLAPAGLSHVGERPRIGLSAAAADCIVDRFELGHLRDTATLRDCARPSSLPFALPHGVSRLQLRQDPFDSDNAAAVTLYARDVRESTTDALVALARSASQFDPADALARAVRETPDAVLDDRPGTKELTTAEGGLHDDTHALVARYLLALHDEDLWQTPAAVSGLPRAQLELAALREGHRKLGLWVLALCAVALAALVVESGLSSSARARAVLAAAGSDATAQHRQRLRSLLTLVATMASLLLVFALVAVYVIVRGRGTLGLP